MVATHQLIRERDSLQREYAKVRQLGGCHQTERLLEKAIRELGKKISEATRNNERDE